MRTCRALGEISGGRVNTAYLSESCSVLTADATLCQRLTCTSTDTRQLMSSLVATIVPCGENGVKPVIRITVMDFSQQTLLDRTFSGTETVSLSSSVDLRVRAIPRDNGITFGLDYADRSPLQNFVNLLDDTLIPVETSEFACPSLPGLSQPAATCTALNTLAQSISNDFAPCTPDVNPTCLAARCVRTDVGLSARLETRSVAIFPCAEPGPAVQVLMIDGMAVAQINATVVNTTTVTAVDSFNGVFTIFVEVNDERTSITIGVRDASTGVTFIPTNTVPFFPSACSMISPPSGTPPSGTPPSGACPTTVSLGAILMLIICART